MLRAPGGACARQEAPRTIPAKRPSPRSLLAPCRADFRFLVFVGVIIYIFHVVLVWLPATFASSNRSERHSRFPGNCRPSNEVENISVGAADLLGDVSLSGERVRHRLRCSQTVRAMCLLVLIVSSTCLFSKIIERFCRKGAQSEADLSRFAAIGRSAFHLPRARLQA